MKETYRSDRQSYKLDLMVGGEKLELFSFPDSPNRPVILKQEGLDILLLK
ncbi:hypothetical protein [Peribacillus frigoritolerans]